MSKHCDYNDSDHHSGLSFMGCCVSATKTSDGSLESGQSTDQSNLNQNNLQSIDAANSRSNSDIFVNLKEDDEVLPGRGTVTGDGELSASLCQLNLNSGTGAGLKATSSQSVTVVMATPVSMATNPSAGQTETDAEPFYTDLRSSEPASTTSNKIPPDEKIAARDDEDFDVFMIYAPEDWDAVQTLKEILLRYLRLAGNRPPTFCMEPMDIPHIADNFDFLSAALAKSNFKFIYLSENFLESKEGWLTFQHHQALWSMIKKRDQSIVPIKKSRDTLLPEFLDMYRSLDMSRLLRGKMLENVDANTLHDDDVDLGLLNNVARMINYAYEKKYVPSVETSLPPPSVPVVSKCSHILQKHFAFLTDHMDPENGLLALLYSKAVITSRQMESIRRCRTWFEMNEELLRYLRQKSDADYEVFLSALIETNQRSIVTTLES